MRALGKGQARPAGEPPDNEPAHKRAVASLALLTHAVADLAAALEATLAEWRHKARMERYCAEKKAAAGKK